MKQTLISLISVFLGIIGANLLAYFYKKYSLGIRGNSISGVFGSIFFIKFFGRLGFNPFFVVLNGQVNIGIFAINCLVSLFGGAVFLILISSLKRKMNKNT